MATSTTPPQLDSGRQRDPERAVRRVGFSQTLGRWDVKVSPYLYISPFFILFVIVGLFPIAYTAVISLQEWDLVRNTGTFVGLDQYIWILSQEQFWVALRNNVSVALRYIAAWLQGVGAAAIDNLMEDAATAEIARCQVWQWLRHGVRLADGRAIDRELVDKLLAEEFAAIESEGDDDTDLLRARDLFAEITLRTYLPEFFTAQAYATHLTG